MSPHPQSKKDKTLRRYQEQENKIEKKDRHYLKQGINNIGGMEILVSPIEQKPSDDK